MAENNYDTIDALLIKTILEEATEDEGQQAKTWISASEANGKYFEQLKLIWEESKKLAIHSDIDDTAAWQEFQRRVREQEARATSKGATAKKGGAIDMETSAREGAGATVDTVGAVRALPWLRVAAALAVIVVGAWFLYSRTGEAPLVSIQAGNQVLTDTLPEGSVVTLNSGSSIRYRKDFAGDTRGVELAGEAFFSVMPDKDKPFVVHAGGAVVKVLGTSFNIKTMADSTELIVETGMVEIQKGTARIEVRAHERVILRKEDQAPVKTANPDRLYNYYRTHAFECEGTPLWRLVGKLNEVYHAHIVIGDPRLDNLALTVSFREESLDRILDIIAATFKSYQLNIVRQGDKIILK